MMIGVRNSGASDVVTRRNAYVFRGNSLNTSRTRSSMTFVLLNRKPDQNRWSRGLTPWDASDVDPLLTLTFDGGQQGPLTSQVE